MIVWTEAEHRQKKKISNTGWLFGIWSWRLETTLVLFIWLTFLLTVAHEYSHSLFHEVHALVWCIDICHHGLRCVSLLGYATINIVSLKKAEFLVSLPGFHSLGCIKRQFLFKRSKTFWIINQHFSPSITLCNHITKQIYKKCAFAHEHMWMQSFF